MTDPFADDDYGPPRDRWGRPLLIPPEGPDNRERIPYTRASTMGNYVQDHSGLHTWEKRLLARGLGCREDLAAMCAALPEPNAAKCDKKELTRQQIAEDKATNAKLDGYIEQALEHAGRSFKANHGTAIHGFTDPGADLTRVPERMRPDVDSWAAAVRLHGLEILATEVFVVNEVLGVAGTFDHLVRHPELGVVVLDKKTGQVDDKALGFSVQLACYAYAEVYDSHTDTRAPLESLTDGESVNQNEGLIAHIPLGAGRTDLYRVDLIFGHRAARLAAMVRTARSQAKNAMAPLAAMREEKIA